MDLRKAAAVGGPRRRGPVNLRTLRSASCTLSKFGSLKTGKLRTLFPVKSPFLASKDHHVSALTELTSARPFGLFKDLSDNFKASNVGKTRERMRAQALSVLSITISSLYNFEFVPFSLLCPANSQEYTKASRKTQSRLSDQIVTSLLLACWPNGFMRVLTNFIVNRPFTPLSQPSANNNEQAPLINIRFI